MAFSFTVKVPWKALFSICPPNVNTSIFPKGTISTGLDFIKEYCSSITYHEAHTNRNINFGTVQLKLGNAVLASNQSTSMILYPTGTTNSPNLRSLTINRTGSNLTQSQLADITQGDGNGLVFQFSIPESQIQGQVITRNFGTSSNFLQCLNYIYTHNGYNSGSNNAFPATGTALDDGFKMYIYLSNTGHQIKAGSAGTSISYTTISNAFSGQGWIIEDGSLY